MEKEGKKGPDNNLNTLYWTLFRMILLIIKKKKAYYYTSTEYPSDLVRNKRAPGAWQQSIKESFDLEKLTELVTKCPFYRLVTGKKKKWVWPERDRKLNKFKNILITIECLCNIYCVFNPTVSRLDAMFPCPLCFFTWIRVSLLTRNKLCNAFKFAL